MILREHLEEVGIGLHAGALEELVTLTDKRLPQHGGTGCRLNLRDIHLQFFFVPIGQPQELIGSQHKCALPLRRLVRHLILLHHVGADQDHKRQAHGQPHRLDGGVQFVAGEEFQVTFHICLTCILRLFIFVTD